MAASSKPHGPPSSKISDVVSTFAPTRKFTPNPGSKPYSVTSIDFDDTGELALVAQDDGILQIYNCKEGKEAKELRSQKYGVDLARFAHHPQSVFFASTMGNDDHIRYLSAHDNRFIRYFRGHEGTVTCLALSPANDNFLSAAQDNTVRLWDMSSDHPQGILNMKAQPTLVAYDPTATILAVACPMAQTILLYDVRGYDKPPFGTFDLQSIENAYPARPPAGRSIPNNNWTKLEISNDGQKMLVGTAGDGHLLLDAYSGKLMAYLVKPEGPTGRLAASGFHELRERRKAGSEHGMPATSQGDVCFSPDGRYVVGGSGEHGLVVWDTQGRAEGEPGAPHMVLRPAHEFGSKTAGKAAVVAYNPRHNLIVSADKSVVFWLPDMD